MHIMTWAHHPEPGPKPYALSKACAHGIHPPMMCHAYLTTPCWQMAPHCCVQNCRRCRFGLGGVLALHKVRTTSLSNTQLIPIHHVRMPTRQERRACKSKKPGKQRHPIQRHVRTPSVRAISRAERWLACLHLERVAAVLRTYIIFVTIACVGREVAHWQQDAPSRCVLHTSLTCLSKF